MTQPTNAVVPLQPQKVAVTPFEPTNLQEAMQLAKTLADSELVPKALQKKPADVLLVIMRGRELGISTVNALASIYPIDGKTTLSSDLIQAIILRSGVLDYFKLVQSTPSIATYEAKRKDSPHVIRLDWTIDDAKQAGLLGKDNWKKYPAAMLRARCAADVAREVAPDVMLGLYDLDEYDDIRASSGAPRVVSATPAETARPTTLDALKGKLAEDEVNVHAGTVFTPTATRTPEAPAVVTVPASIQTSPIGGPQEASGSSQDEPAPNTPSESSQPEIVQGAQAQEAPPAQQPTNGEPKDIDPADADVFKHRLRSGRLPKEPWAAWKDKAPWKGPLLNLSAERLIQDEKNGYGHTNLRSALEWALRNANGELGKLEERMVQADYCLAYLDERWNIDPPPNF